MIIVKKQINIEIDTLQYTEYNSADCILFDIETTGFTPKNTLVYLIGAVYFENNSWNAIQWFASTKESETEILIAFFEFAKKFKVIIHFNGEGFDIPYLIKKAEILGIGNPFENLLSIDIFKSISQVKRYLKLNNYKQKTIEKFLGISRDDKYSGGELINVYSHFLKTQDSEAYDLLLLHNYDDIIGMTQIFPMLSYNVLINGNFIVESFLHTDDEIIFNCVLPVTLPKRISLGFKDYYITAYGNTLKLRIKIYKDELKYFYSNYKDYYYLPVEDMAIHKSVAFYVDKEFRTKAKAANCYSKKTGTFIQQLNEIVPTFFKIDFSDKTMYIELTDEFLNDTSTIHAYIKDILCYK